MSELKAQAELEILNKQLIVNDGFLEAVTETYTTTKMQLNNKIADLKKQIADAEVTYSIGDRFKSHTGGTEDRMIVGGDGQMFMIDLDDGEIMQGPVTYDGYCGEKISQSVFDTLAGTTSYHRTWDNRKQQKVSE